MRRVLNTSGLVRWGVIALACLGALVITSQALSQVLQWEERLAVLDYTAWHGGEQVYINESLRVGTAQPGWLAQRVDSVAHALVQSPLPIGRAYPGSGSPTRVVRCTNGLFLSKFSLVSFGFWFWPEGEGGYGPMFSQPYVHGPVREVLRKRDRLIVLFFGSVHIVAVSSAFLAFRFFASPQGVRRISLTLRVFPRIIAESAILCALLPALAQFLWSVWRRVPFYVTSASNTNHEAVMQADPGTFPLIHVPPVQIPDNPNAIIIDALTNNVVSMDHFHGVAVGPAGRTLVLAGIALAYLLIVAWVVRRNLARVLDRELKSGTVCGHCRYTLGAADTRCPECGNLRLQPPVRVALGRAMYRIGATRWRWAIRGLALGSVLALLCGPLILGWIGYLLPDDLWLRFMPY